MVFTLQIPNIKTGLGFDSHQFQANKKLILGGIEIPFDKGLKGHSDGDVLIHAIIDSLLGAAGLNDIGEYFPPTDKSIENINSVFMLKEICKILKENQWEIINLDCVLICEKPKISDYKQKIIINLAQEMGIKEKQINLKGKTAEKMGSLGREEGIACLVNCLIYFSGAL